MDIQSLIELLSPITIYDGGYQLAQFIAAYITPFLLTIALAIRTLETQLDAVTTACPQCNEKARQNSFPPINHKQF